MLGRASVTALKLRDPLRELWVAFGVLLGHSWGYLGIVGGTFGDTFGGTVFITIPEFLLQN